MHRAGLPKCIELLTWSYVWWNLGLPKCIELCPWSYVWWNLGLPKPGPQMHRVMHLELCLVESGAPQMHRVMHLELCLVQSGAFQIHLRYALGVMFEEGDKVSVKSRMRNAKGKECKAVKETCKASKRAKPRKKSALMH
jgi:hypothetical protein